MATLSVKVTTADRDRFEQWCEDQGGTVSSLLREFVRMAPKCRRLEVVDPVVGPPAGLLYLEDDDSKA